MTKAIKSQKTKTARPVSINPAYINAQDRLENALSNLEGLISALHAGAESAEFVQIPKVMNLARELVEESQEARRVLFDVVDRYVGATAEADELYA